MMHKIIFLDIDGVLNNAALGTKDRDIWKLFNDIDTDGGKLSSINIKNLNDITDQTGADIVISSSWRILYDIHELRDILRDAGVTGSVINYTLNLPGRGMKRGNEIQCYIEDHYPFKKGIGYSVRYAILDDDSDMLYWHRDSFFWCDPDCGLSQNIAYKCINHLGLK